MAVKRRTARARHDAAVRTVTPETYDMLLRAQGGGCAICATTPKTRRLHIDTDHRDGFRVRGLLCHRCNQGLQFFSDSPERLRAAADYLEQHSTAT